MSRSGSKSSIPSVSKLQKPGTLVSRSNQSQIQTTASGTRVSAQARVSQTTVRPAGAASTGLRQPSTSRQYPTASTSTARQNVPASCSTGAPVNQPTIRVRLTGISGTSQPATRQTTATTLNIAKKVQPQQRATNAPRDIPLKGKICGREASKKQVPTSRQPEFEPFTAEVEAGRHVPPGRYYYPCRAAAEGLSSPAKLRQKLQRFTPTTLSHYKVEHKDTFARDLAPLRQQHPDIVSGMFQVPHPDPNFQMENAQRQAYFEQSMNPYLPETQWSMSLRETMNLQQGEFQGPEGINEIEQSNIERNLQANLPASPQSPQRVVKTTTPQAIYPTSPQRAGIIQNIAPPANRSPSPSLPNTIAYQSPPRNVLSPTRTPSPPRQMIAFPETSNTNTVQFVPSPGMQGPAGYIDAQNVLHMDRQLDSSELGTVINTQMIGTRTISPGQAQQILVNKNDRIPPSGLPLENRVRFEDHRSRSPPQIVVTSPKENFLNYSQHSQPSQSPRRVSSPTAELRAPEMTSQRYSSMPLHSTTIYTSPVQQQIIQSQPIISQQSVQAATVLETTRTIAPVDKSGEHARNIFNISVEIPNNIHNVTLETIHELLDEERQDVINSSALNPALQVKLNRLRDNDLLEETIEEAIPREATDESSSHGKQSEIKKSLPTKSDMLATMLYSEETGHIDVSKSPKKTYNVLFGKKSSEDHTTVVVTSAAPAPLQDIVVPVGEPPADEIADKSVAFTKDIQEDVTEDIPEARAYSESLSGAQTPSGTKSPAMQASKYQSPEAQTPRSETISKTEGDEAAYIRRPGGELEEEKAPWDINLEYLEELAGGQLAVKTPSWQLPIPSNESLRTTLQRIDYLLDMEKPKHYSCVQLRGSQKPSWFPGYYFVSDQLINSVSVEREPEKVFAYAWSILKPEHLQGDTEIIML